ncbi:MAG: hypothetical protein LBE91_05870 [Tannerella sp.]|jgi:hypothetical protein|nr:hypothetical protein [Tannerella sp.]
MFHFRNLQDTYIVSVSHIFPDDRTATVMYKQDVLAHKVKKTYRFELLQRHGMQIDGESPGDISEIIMMELGDSLYPLVLNVEEDGEILSIENFDEVRTRRSNKEKELNSKYQSFEFEQYLKAAKDNMKDEKTLRMGLGRDAFIQFYFRDTDRSDWYFHIFDFPFPDIQLMYYALRKKKPILHKDSIPVRMPEDNYEIHPAFQLTDVLRNEGTVYCKRAVAGDIQEMKLYINLLKDDDTYYRRKITLSRDENTERITDNFWI